MSETKWNPGPWIVPEPNIENPNFDYLGGRQGYVIQSDSTSFDEMEWCIAIVLDDGPKGHGNAHLIASAPALYEALEDMLSGWKYIRKYHGDLYGVGWDRAQDKAEAALAQARGETK